MAPHIAYSAVMLEFVLKYRHKNSDAFVQTLVNDIQTQCGRIPDQSILGVRLLFHDMRAAFLSAALNYSSMMDTYISLTPRVSVACYVFA